MKKEIERISKKLFSYFDRDRINALGKSSRLVQRSTSKFGGYEFLLMNVFDRLKGSEKSLNDSCDWLEEHFGISMTKQGLDERYNTYSVSFMKSCFEELLSKLNEDRLKKLDLKGFNCIQLTDATSFRIGDDLSVFYKGYKGSGGQAVLKMHLNYDLLSGKIEEIALGDGSKNDNSYNFGSKEEIVEEGLYLRDLGYYGFDYFKKLDEEGAYYLSRAKSNTTFYQKRETGKYEKLKWEELLPEGSELKDFPQIYIGSYKKKLSVRLVIGKVPEEVAQKRLEKLKKYAQKQKDKTVSEQRKAMCHYNIFITNVPAEKLAEQKIRAVYSLRWQIEIVFKLWKSHYNIDKTRKMGIFRFECHIYAQLIAFLLDDGLRQAMEPVFWENLGQEMSLIKASKFIKKNFIIY